MKLAISLWLSGCLCLALACTAGKDAADDSGAAVVTPSTSCRDFCTDNVSVWHDIIQGASAKPATEAELEASCAKAPTDGDCAQCMGYIQDVLFTPFDVGWDCGCGLEPAGLRECSQDPTLSDEAAEERLESCFEICDAEGMRT